MVDPEKIRTLVEMMSEFDLTEINLRDGEEEIRLTRPGPETHPMISGSGPSGHVVMPAPVQAAPAPAPVEPAAPAPAATPVAADNLNAVKSPMVGTLYLSPDPSSPPFVSVGTRVTPTTVVCIIEAMKVFNEIQADVTGTVVEVLVNNEDPVEFGQPMFMVRPD
ncbi:MAG TPA: acetyl-CoA carboxylase biotin carboxyl carrier protein [Phycisphaerae bacterium]|nr:acetyl-CoA carboxylase biotin carboxyl carrier protein [Phycisphaerales bacterium]HNO79539.1 acetyl-CoA carboxylase biotin carboxyl carrier protein [Phycisphaerae bacterium]